MPGTEFPIGWFALTTHFILAWKRDWIWNWAGTAIKTYQGNDKSIQLYFANTKAWQLNTTMQFEFCVKNPPTIT